MLFNANPHFLLLLLVKPLAHHLLLLLPLLLSAPPGLADTLPPLLSFGMSSPARPGSTYLSFHLLIVPMNF